MSHLSKTLFALLAAVMIGSSPAPALACATAPLEGETVHTASEEAIILWDEAQKKQHFIRRANFVASGKDFGFLVPTPSKPELGEVNAAVFQQLTNHLQPKTQPGGFEFTGGCASLDFFRGAEKSASYELEPVRVLHTQTVAGFDAVVLSADDPAALSAWLKERNYAQGPGLSEWLSEYVKNRWVITAFKVSRQPDSGPTTPIGTAAVRMSFDTDRPFYPYREPVGTPSEGRPPARLLRVFFLSDVRYDATLGDAGAFAGATKLADVVEIPAELQPMVTGERFLTVFDDQSSPRVGTAEVFFHQAKNTAPLRIPPLLEPRRVYIPVEPVVLVAVAGFVVYRRVARRKATRA